jgi:hypothetical protein
MTVDRETREAVARSIYCTARPGHRWFDEPPEVLEYWGGLADAAIETLTPPPGTRADGDKRCQVCGQPNIVWFTDSDVWNKVRPNGGVLCVPCFVREAEAMSINRSAWYLTREHE